MHKKVSIIIPAYNAAKYLAETIESVINQTYTNWELIIVNDGSTDNTPQIIETYCQKDKRIIAIHKKNEGVSIARNVGMQKAQGEYIAFLDADDVWLEENLETKIHELNQNQDIFWVYSDLYLHNEKKQTIFEKKLTETSNILESLLLWDGSIFTCPSNIVINRTCYEQGCVFDKSFSTAADQDFCISLASRFKGFHVKKSLWKYRIVAGSMSHNLFLMEKDHIAVYNKAVRKGLFKSWLFKQKCFSHLFLILAGSWWYDGNKKIKAFKFLILAFVYYPPSLIKKLLNILLNRN